ncbi:MAG: hypothetical protein R2748_23155 [Bryobacterales bacterium]
MLSIEGRTGLVGRLDVARRNVAGRCWGRWIGKEDRLRAAAGGDDFCDFRSAILLRSLDAPERLRGPNLAWFGVDG